MNIPEAIECRNAGKFDVCCLHRWKGRYLQSMSFSIKKIDVICWIQQISNAITNTASFILYVAVQNIFFVPSRIVF